MKYFEVGYERDGIYSVNIITANTGANEIDAARETAQRRAAKRGYEVAYVSEISECRANEYCWKGMPLYSIDEEAERKYDPSFQD